MMVAATLLLAAPWAAVGADRECDDGSRTNAAAKKDPEPGPAKGKVEDGVWQKTRWKEKSIEASTEKEVRRKISRTREERVRPAPSEREIGVPDRF